jgi:hypothetical protein
MANVRPLDPLLYGDGFMSVAAAAKQMRTSAARVKWLAQVNVLSWRRNPWDGEIEVEPAVMKGNPPP